MTYEQSQLSYFFFFFAFYYFTHIPTFLSQTLWRGDFILLIFVTAHFPLLNLFLPQLKA